MLSRSKRVRGDRRDPSIDDIAGLSDWVMSNQRVSHCAMRYTTLDESHDKRVPSSMYVVMGTPIAG